MSDSDDNQVVKEPRRRKRTFQEAVSTEDANEDPPSSRSPSPALPSRLDRIPSPSSYEVAPERSYQEGNQIVRKNDTGKDVVESKAKERSRSRSVEKKRKSRSPKRIKKRSISRSPVRNRKSRSISRSPVRRKRSRSRSPRKSRRSRSPVRRKRSRSRSRDRRRRRSRSNSRERRRKSRSNSRERRRKSRSSSRERRRKSRSNSRQRRRRSRSNSRERRPKSRSRSRDRRRSRSRSRERRRHRNGGRPRRSYSRSPSPHFTSKWGMKRTHGLTRAVLPANPNDKKPKVLSTQEVEEKVARHMRTVKEKAEEEAKRINLPGYLNPAMVNVHQFKQVQDKRKLLWSKTKDKKESATQWAGAFDDQGNDEKFKRFMGIQGVKVNADDSQVSNSKRVLDDLEKEYEKSRAFQMSRGAGGLTGIGLGFGSMPSQP